MSVDLTPPAATVRPRPIASFRHTALLVSIFVVLAVAGAFFQRASSSKGGPARTPNPIPLYSSLLLVEWGLFLTITRAVRRTSGTSIRDLVGGRWTGARDVAVDAGLAASVWLAWRVVIAVLPETGAGAAVQAMLPHGMTASILWIALSVSAGICEEVAFRGYFQKQFEALTGRPWLALAAQSLLFGISHGYQGAAACGRIVLYGALFGLLALWRKSLRPGMMAHAWTDIAGGLAVFARLPG